MEEPKISDYLATVKDIGHNERINGREIQKIKNVIAELSEKLEKLDKLVR